MGRRILVREGEPAALGRQREALRPAVDGRLRQRPAVQGRLPAHSGAVGDAQDPSGLAGRDVGVRLDGPGGDRQRVGLAADDGGPGDLAVDTPQGTAVELAEPAQARGGVEHAAHLARRSVAHKDVTDRETAELAGLVGAGTRDQIGDDLVEPGVAAARLGELGVTEAPAGAADQGVRDLRGRGAAEYEGSWLVAGVALRGHERGHLDRVAALERLRRPAEHPVGRGQQRGEAGGQRDERGERLAPAEALGGDPGAGALRPEDGGREQRDAVDQGGGARPAGRVVAGAVDEHREDQRDQGDGPGRPDREAALLAQQRGEGGQHDADHHEAAEGLGPAGTDAEQVERTGRARSVGQARLAEEARGTGQQRQRPRGEDEDRGADGGEEAQRVGGDVVAAQHEDADAENNGERPYDRREGHREGEQQRVGPGGPPAAAGAALGAQPVGGDGGAGEQRQHDREDGRAEAAGGQGAGGGRQEGVGDARPGAQQPGFDDGA